MAQPHWKDTLDPIIVRLLNPYNSNPHQGAQLHLDQPPTIQLINNNQTHQIQTATIALLIQETRSTTLIQTARIILTLTNPSHERALHTHLTWDDDLSRPCTKPYTILDTTTTTTTHPQPIPNPTKNNDKDTLLRETYHAYIAAINTQAPLDPYTHPTITHNGAVLDRATYTRLMADAQAAIAELEFVVGEHDVVADAARQMVGARIRFHGLARKEWGGVRVDGEERRVEFGEVVFYWWEEGRIREVVSLVDMERYRAQVEGGEV